MNGLKKSTMNSDCQAAVFLDRDGTIIEDRGHLADPSEAVFFPDTFEALAALQKRYRLFIVTNQSGVAQGLLTMEAVQRVNRHITAVLREKGIEITNVYVCPHGREDRCACRKPHPHFLKKAAAEHGIDLLRSFSVGDHPCDAELAQLVGGQGIYLLTGHGEKHRQEVPPGVPVLANLRTAANWILAEGGGEPDREICRAAEIVRQSEVKPPGGRVIRQTLF